MNVATKLVGFLVALLVVFGGAVGLGKAVGPVDPVASPEHEVSDEGNHADMDMEPETDPDTEGSSPTTSYPKGLMVSQDGYTFRLVETTCRTRHCGAGDLHDRRRRRSRGHGL